MEIQSNEIMMMNTIYGFYVAVDLSISLLIGAVYAGKSGRNQNGNLSISCGLIGAEL